MLSYFLILKEIIIHHFKMFKRCFLQKQEKEKIFIDLPKIIRFVLIPEDLLSNKQHSVFNILHK